MSLWDVHDVTLNVTRMPRVVIDRQWTTSSSRVRPRTIVAKRTSPKTLLGVQSGSAVNLHSHGPCIADVAGERQIARLSVMPRHIAAICGKQSSSANVQSGDVGEFSTVKTRTVAAAQRFRRIALALEGAVEGAHMGHPDFRVDKRIFASLHHEDQFGMVKLTPEQQAVFIEDHPNAFTPEAGAWGRSGCTRVLLKAVPKTHWAKRSTLAWQNTRKLPRKKISPQ